VASLPKFEVAVGPIDGVNVAFTVSVPYRAGSVAVFLNGQLKRKDFVDGWVETSPVGGIVTLTEAPRVGDVVQVFFIDDAASGADVVELSPLRGVIVATEDLSGRFQPVYELVGKIQDC
jgi:hypothetical protein